ncbi:unnamed protein product [Toxocara canis]|uniref:TPX2_importin domain-containing protein n=1 Tax=Toxocara canis TaxID=6265 RepID=A0A183UR81_TOXCA|nr:unnamed protein product [Toxocara canis]
MVRKRIGTGSSIILESVAKSADDANNATFLSVREIIRRNTNDRVTSTVLNKNIMQKKAFEREKRGATLPIRAKGKGKGSAKASSSIFHSHQSNHAIHSKLKPTPTHARHPPELMHKTISSRQRIHKRSSTFRSTMTSRVPKDRVKSTVPGSAKDEDSAKMISTNCWTASPGIKSSLVQEESATHYEMAAARIQALPQDQKIFRRGTLMAIAAFSIIACVTSVVLFVFTYKGVIMSSGVTPAASTERPATNL